MARKPSKTLNYEKAARSDLRLLQCAYVYILKIINAPISEKKRGSYYYSCMLLVCIVQILAKKKEESFGLLCLVTARFCCDRRPENHWRDWINLDSSLCIASQEQNYPPQVHTCAQILRMSGLRSYYVLFLNKTTVLKKVGVLLWMASAGTLK